jgi:two-component system CheB/CheR fusion protein
MPDYLVPVTAIGASAGGLEPIEIFFDSMPVDSGSAFVIIQHLSPDFRSLMDELLARHSSMNIHRVTDGMVIEPNSIYLNPPRAVMTLDGNTLSVESIQAQEAVYLPIDLFFQSLAKSRKESAIALVLSGTGSDGTLGAHAVAQAGGKVLVQDPETTRFNGMPKSVIADKHYELIASPSDLATSVARVLRKESLEGLSADIREPMEEPFQDILSILKHRYGTDFEQYKEATVKRRIERRAQMRRISDVNDYRDFLHSEEQELQELYADLLIEVTEFFRDPAAFEVLRMHVIPELMSDMKDGDSIRVWVPGCASGEEAYSIAIILLEQSRTLGIKPHIKILATDIHIRSMNKASSGIYPEESLAGVPTELVQRYFDCADDQAQIKPNVRNMLFFSTHDVMRDPPFTRIDLISCRNLLIYLKENAQEKVINLLHFSLRKDGFLFLGPSEHIGAIAHEFKTQNEKWRIYQKRRDIKLLPEESIFKRADVSTGVASTSVLPRSALPANISVAQNGRSISFKRAQRVALEHIVSEYAPPGFLLAEDGTVVHIFGNAGGLLPMSSGSFSRDILDLIRPDLKVIVSAALEHARGKEFKEFKRAAYVKNADSLPLNYEITMQKLELPGESIRFLLLSVEEHNTTEKKQVVGKRQVTQFENDESSKVLRDRILVLEHSLQSSEESLQSTIEELETSNEELQSTNEELMSTNEELQSTNEELHSVNEELYTVSAEHQRKNEELTERDIDLDTILQLSKIGTIHLDENLILRRYSSTVRGVFNLLPTDVGRPFNHITLRTKEHDVNAMIEEVRTKQEARETQVVIGDSIFLLRILPHDRHDGDFRGVLLTVIDITDLQLMRNKLELLNVQHKDIGETTNSFVVRWDNKTHLITYCNQLFADRWGLSIEEAIGKNIVELRKPQYRQAFLDFVGGAKVGVSLSREFSVEDHEGHMRSARVTIRGTGIDGKHIDEFQANGTDITEEVHYEEAIKELYTAFSYGIDQPEEKLRKILSIGLEYYDLDTAAVSIIDGETYAVKAVLSHVETTLEVGLTLPLNDTMCSQFVDSGKSLAINNVSKSNYGHLPCHQKTQIESFVGAVVQTSHGRRGTVSFSSLKPRYRDFSQAEERFCLLMSGWIGYLLGNQDQIEFISKQNEYYKTLFESVPAMMFLCNSEGHIISMSDELLRQIGCSKESMTGKNCMTLFSPDDHEQIMKAIKKGKCSKMPSFMRRKNIEDIEIELSMDIKPIGTLKGVRMAVIADVSQRNEAARDVAEQNRRLAVANENLNKFAFIASHDLQEPLRKIQQFSSFIEEDLSEVINDDARYHLNVIVEASKRMTSLIRDLLSFSSTTNVEVSKEKIDMNGLIDKVVNDLEMPIAEADAIIDIKTMNNVLGNEALLTQLFSNLISNGVKYRSSDRKPVISVYTAEYNGKEQIVVEDNGIGFDSKFSKKIFEPFNRLHSSSDYKGSGIGLAICQTVCEKHGWNIAADSIRNQGSRFTITVKDE